jgi:phosphoglucosamine mutase
MARKYFGTDGIRGRSNVGAMTPEMAMKVGQAAGTHFLRGGHKHRVVIGKDTRLSGYMWSSLARFRRLLSPCLPGRCARIWA